MSVPSMMIEPLSGLSSPMRVLRKTDLPVPEGPEHHADLARRDGQGHVAPDQLLAERLGEVVDHDLDTHVRGPLPPRAHRYSRVVQRRCAREVTPVRGHAPRRHSAPAASDLGVDRRDDLVEVADDGVGRLGDHRRVGIGVDRQDVLRAAAPGPVLDGTADAARDVEVGRDPAAGLADLLVVRAPAERGDDAGDAQGGVEQVGELEDLAEAVGRAGSATGADDDARRLEGAGQVGLGLLARDDPGDQVGVGDVAASRRPARRRRGRRPGAPAPRGRRR